MAAYGDIQLTKKGPFVVLEKLVVNDGVDGTKAAPEQAGDGDSNNDDCDEDVLV